MVTGFIRTPFVGKIYYLYMVKVFFFMYIDNRCRTPFDYFVHLLLLILNPFGENPSFAPAWNRSPNGNGLGLLSLTQAQKGSSWGEDPPSRYKETTVPFFNHYGTLTHSNKLKNTYFRLYKVYSILNTITKHSTTNAYTPNNTWIIKSHYYNPSMSRGLFKNISRCMSDPPKKQCIFKGFTAGTT